MDSETLTFTEAENFLNSDQSKSKVITPKTADSTLNQNSIHDFSIEGANLFTQIDFHLEQPIQQVQGEQEIFSPYYETENQIKEKFNFDIVLKMTNQDTEQVEFDKKVDILREKQDKCRIVFEKQHQKKNIRLQTPYKLTLYMRQSEGFTKKIWEIQRKFSRQSKRENIKVEENNIKLCFQLQNFNSNFIKFLGLEIPSETVNQFFQYRSQLLNKSPLLNQIKNITELKGLYYQLSQQNMGSRILQKLVQKASRTELTKMAFQIKPYFKEMILSNYGNYVIQKIFAYSPSDLRSTFLQWIQNKFLNIVKTKAGTHSLQAIIELLDVNSLQKVYELVNGNEVDLCNDEFGTHFMQKLVELNINYEFIYKILLNFNKISVNKYGIVVLKKIMKLTSVDYNIRCYMIQSCQNNFNEISDTQYGHYIIEQLFLYYSQLQLQTILDHIATYVVYISQSVYSSSIIRKGLETFSQNWSNKLICILMNNQGQGSRELMETNPGTFVLHRIIEKSEKSAYKEYLLDSIKKNIDKLNSYQKRNKWLIFFN